MEHYLRSIFIVFCLLVLQTTFIPYISIAGILPDLLLIWLMYLALKRGQIEATVAGFFVGLLQDILVTHFFGLAALSKTVSGFIAGYFFNENKMEQTLSTYRFVALTGMVSLLHNLLYLSIFLQGTAESFLQSLIILSVGTALYTATVSILPVFTFARKSLAVGSQ
ncbi:MAG: rod shape-determining protein MreD [bacterium]